MEVLLQAKDVVLLLVGFVTLLTLIGGGVFYLMSTRFIEKKDFDKLCKENRESCHLVVCKKIDDLNEHVKKLHEDSTLMKLWLIPVITLIAEKLQISIEQMPR